MNALPPDRRDVLTRELADAGRSRGLGRAGLVAMAAAVAGVALLGVAGWFLTGAALAALAGTVAAFNYLVPSATIRLAAVVRTGGRYFERLWSHEAALQALARVRVGLFGQLARRDPRAVRDLMLGDGVARLTGDVDALEDAIIRAPARPAALAGGAMAVLLALPAGILPALALAAGLWALPLVAGRVARRLVDAPAAEAQARMAALKALVTDQLAASAEIAVYGLAGRVSADVMAEAAALDRARALMVRGEAWLAGVLVAAGPVLAALLAGLAALGGAGAAATALAALAAAGGAEAQGAYVRARGRDAALATARGRLEGLDEAGAAGEAMPDGEALQIDGRTLAPGARLGIVGVSGRGKTRLLETLAGWRSDAPQPLLLGGVDVRALAFAALAARFALVPQAPALIAGSVADNLRLAAPGLSEADLWAALEVACLAEDVRAMAGGLETWLGEGAGQLSGGQRKRLALARALLAAQAGGRPWLLLDEPSEGLDAATEAEVVRRLGDWLDRTGTGVIVASHRAAPLGLVGDVLRL
jgi:ATP-binding cassette subfamily C protein CydC